MSTQCLRNSVDNVYTMAHNEPMNNTDRLNRIIANATTATPKSDASGDPVRTWTGVVNNRKVEVRIPGYEGTEGIRFNVTTWDSGFTTFNRDEVAA